MHNNDPMFNLGRQQGAIDFCQYLRGKSNAFNLLAAWDEFQSGYEPNLSLSAPAEIIPLPNRALRGVSMPGMTAVLQSESNVSHT